MPFNVALKSLGWLFGDCPFFWILSGAFPVVYDQQIHRALFQLDCPKMSVTSLNGAEKSIDVFYRRLGRNITPRRDQEIRVFLRIFQ